MRELSAPASGVFAVTPDDADFFSTPARSLYVGGAGDVSVVAEDGTEAVFSAVPVGTVLPVRCKRVNATGTTATLIIGLV
jgi:hypothetical protein